MKITVEQVTVYRADKRTFKTREGVIKHVADGIVSRMLIREAQRRGHASERKGGYTYQQWQDFIARLREKASRRIRALPF